MPNPENFDVVVLGSGEAGKILAWTLASQGKRSVVVERLYIGGSCPNIACLPSKNVIHRRRSPRISGGAPSSGSPRATGRSRCPGSATANARWSTG